MVVDIEDHACPCCRNDLHRIGEDVSERLDIVPAQFAVIVVRRPKYACRACEDVVVQAPAPARLIEGGMPTEATVAQVLVVQICRSPAALSPGADLRPAGHQARSLDARRLGRPRRLARCGRCMSGCSSKLKASTKLFADETTAPVLDPGRGRDQDGPALGLCPRRPAVGRRPIRRASPMSMRRTARPSGRSRISPASAASCRSTAMAAIARSPSKRGVTLAFCWAHVRRRFYELAAAGPAPIASEALERIAELYRIEADIRGRSADERRAVRQERSRADRRRPRTLAARASSG